MDKEPTVIEPGFITRVIPKDRNCIGRTGDEGMASIVLLNDNVTLFSYVVFCLVEVDFGMNYKSASETMIFAHRHGQAHVGQYPIGFAEQLLRDVDKLNILHGQNLRFLLIQ